MDIQQAFNEVRHIGLLFKLKKLLPTPYDLLLRSYFDDRSFYVIVNDQISKIYDIKAGVPQGILDAKAWVRIAGQSQKKKK